jgi:hypothetical protein
MQAKPLITHFALATLVFASAAARAGEASPGPTPMSSASRADVIAELDRARAAGELNLPSALYGRIDLALAGSRSTPPARTSATTLHAASSRTLDTHDYVGG